MCSIRPARVQESGRLSALALRSKAVWGYDRAFMAQCARELTITPQFLRESPAYVIEADGQIVGFYGLGRVDDTRVELDYMFVEPDRIGRGYGRRLMAHARAEARALGYRVMVIQSDPNATRFYESAGAVLVGRRESASIPGRTLPVLHLPLDERAR